MTSMDLKLFALNASRGLGEKVAEGLSLPLARHEEREFEDGEQKARPLETVPGRDVYVIQSLYGDREQSANDKLVRLLFFLGLEARCLFVELFASRAAGGPVAVVSPDGGGVKRADAFRESLERRLGHPITRAFMEKRRSEGVVSGDLLVGEVAGRNVIIVDDLVSSGTTPNRAVEACKAHGASKIYAAATHGLFTAKAAELLANESLKGLAVTDTVPPFRLDAALVEEKLRVVTCVPLIADAIRRMHTNGSLTELMQD